MAEKQEWQLRMEWYDENDDWHSQDFIPAGKPDEAGMSAMVTYIRVMNPGAKDILASMWCRQVSSWRMVGNVVRGER